MRVNEDDLPRSLMFQIPSDWEVVRLCFFASFLTSFSVVAGALSSDIDKPATAESTRVSSADMMWSVERSVME